MKIELTNLSDDRETVFSAVLFIKGHIVNSEEEGEESPREKHIYVKHSLVGDYVAKCRAWPLNKNSFKVLVQLRPGENLLAFEYCRVLKNVSVVFDPRTKDEYTVRLLYIIPANTDGFFQAPKQWDNSVESAKKRIQLAGSLIQCFFGESLRSHGLGRKTFTLASDEAGTPVCSVFKSKLTIQEAHTMAGSELWEYHAKELLSAGIANDVTKCLAITSATRYENPQEIEPKDHNEVVSLTKAHVAMGGGGLALFGSGCLYTWPEKLCEVQQNFLDQLPIDRKKFMDDSGYRHTMGGCFASTLGAMVHELGHTFDLGHTHDGIMARGFDDMDKVFAFPPLKTNGNLVKSSLLESPPPLPSCSKQKSARNMTRITPIIRVGKGSQFLVQYQQKKEYTKMIQDCGGAYWNRSCALILSVQRWLSLGSDPSDHPILREGNNLTSALSPFIVIEFRDEHGNVIGFKEFVGAELDCHTIPFKVLSISYPGASEFCAANMAGAVLRDVIMGGKNSNNNK